MKEIMELTQEELKSILDYNSETGTFTRKISVASNKIKVGDIAGNLNNSTGYILIRVNGKRYRAHRLVWLYMYGNFPEQQIDHINHNRADNRLENLREVTRSENQKNRSVNKNNTTGVKGVILDKRRNTYQVRINDGGKLKCCGSFKTLEEAKQRASEVYKELGFHPNHYIDTNSLTTPS